MKINFIKKIEEKQGSKLDLATKIKLVCKYNAYTHESFFDRGKIILIRKGHEKNPRLSREAKRFVRKGTKH